MPRERVCQCWRMGIDTPAPAKVRQVVGQNISKYKLIKAYKVMKYRTTQKAVKGNFSKVFAVGYCGLSDLLRFEEPRAYTCGVYGWNADIYEFGGVAVATGYRPFGQDIPATIVRKYEEQARAIGGDYSRPYAERREAVGALLVEFLKELQTL